VAEDETTDESQKTEDPTPRKLEEARKKGQVINSREINNWMVLFTATIIVVTALPGILQDSKTIFRNFLEQSYAVPSGAVGIGNAIHTLFSEIGTYVILPLVILSFAGAIAGFLQTGPLFTVEPLKPDLSKVSIIKGFGRLFSKRSMMEMIKGVIKLVLVSIAGVVVLKPYFYNSEYFITTDLNQGMSDMGSLFLKMMIAVLSVLFLLAILDYVFQRSEFMKSMRMSKEEVKEEYKQTEGDPHVKGRLKRLREEKARKRMMQAVPTADVVITNPTHYAVALKYDSKEMNAPVMVAKGVDAVAERIKAVAKENNVPVVENPVLARTLYSSMEIDQMIPREQYKAVAEVISYVFKLKGKKA